MSVNIDLPADVENILRRRAAAVGEDLASFLSQLVTESLVEDDEGVPEAISEVELAQRLDAWIALHPVLDRVVDDSRESIYAGLNE
ncbi:MAG: hypothetical protein JWM11_2832 [Planctomycetaceae bacterium]|nr:hypothetical protein [Planctomycetaceae bacterium]